MRFRIQTTSLITVTALLFAPLCFSQDDASNPDAVSTENAEEITDTAVDQEVEINEDNYRQFMELKDADRQRTVIPETAFKSQAGLQKLDELPEESQKHLRDQLREIIVQGDPWQPGDEDSEYPYTPSEAASANQPLQKKEAEAWGELVDSYHQREAQIHGNAARSEAAAAAAAAAAGGGFGESSNGETGSAGGGQEQGSQGQQASAQGRSTQNPAASSYSPGANSDQNEKSTAGVSQNAMEFLKAQAGSAGSSTNPATGNSASANSNQQQEVVDENAQNALEFLKANATAGTTSDSASTASSDSTKTEAGTPPPSPNSNNEVTVKQENAQNALEYLNNTTQTDSGTNAGEDTLSIEELRNAQGVFNVSGENVQPVVDDEPGGEKNDG